LKLIALMVMRNEAWVIGASLRAALRWCDGAAILLDRCTDATVEIVRDIAKRTDKEVVVSETDEAEHWDEMYHRQRNLEDGRNLGGTHFAIVDADEILTHNNLPHVRGWFRDLEPGRVLDAKMIAPWKSLDVHSPHTEGIITLGFRDAEGMGWAPRGDEQYHHHNRPPHGMTGRVRHLDAKGGVFHLQFAAWDRFITKHRHYLMSEYLRWQYPATELNAKYAWWSQPPHGTELEPIPAEWWGDYAKDEINLNAPVWYDREIRRMLREYGASRFRGLELIGWRPDAAQRD
jgi:hypothetical protein